MLCRFLFAILCWLSPSRTSRKQYQPITASLSLFYIGTSLLLYPGKVHHGPLYYTFFFSVLLRSVLLIFPLCSVRPSLLLYPGKVQPGPLISIAFLSLLLHFSFNFLLLCSKGPSLLLFLVNSILFLILSICSLYIFLSLCSEESFLQLLLV